MAERKSDYMGDEFGDWKVIAKPERQDWMIKGKRYWDVHNSVTDEYRICEQTKLKELPKEDAVDPRPLVAVGANFAVDEGWADGLLTVELPQDRWMGPPLPEGEDYHVGEAPELGCVKSKVTMANLDAALGITKPVYEPKGVNAESAVIARAALGQTEADAPNVVWSDDIPIDNTVTKFGGIGEAAEVEVSEAELDGRVPEQDPARALLRQIMGQIHTVREQAMALDEQLVELRIQADLLMDSADQLLKELITNR